MEKTKPGMESRKRTLPKRKGTKKHFWTPSRIKSLREFLRASKQVGYGTEEELWKALNSKPTAKYPSG